VRRVDGSIAWAALDLVSCLLLVVYTLIAPPRARAARIVTQGAYAVVLQWPRASRDDIDLYVKDSSGNVSWFGKPDTASLQLEHDDLGAGTGTSYQFGPNYERIVIRASAAGTYAAVVHVYCKLERGPAHGSVSLWRLGANQRPLENRTLVLRTAGDEQTAFRWTVDSRGNLTGIDHLPVTISQAAGLGCG
jgi:hypothetical protein